MSEETASVQEKDRPTQTEKRDWVEEAYTCFIKDADGIDPTDPVKAVEAYFEKNATDDLKARCKAEGKDARNCWIFIEAVARKALKGRQGHIDPGVVYAIAMHWFEDVPKDWNKPTKATRHDTDKAMKTEGARQPAARKPAETPSEIRKEKERIAKAKAKVKSRPKKSGVRQGFFFDILEMQMDGPTNGPSSPRASAGASEEENAVVPCTQPASTSATGSEAANVDERGGESC